MPVHNSDIAGIFNRVADLLEIKGANQFRIRAYRNGARSVEGLSQNISELISKEEDLRKLPGIGKDLAAKIKTIVETGSLPLLEDLEGDFPAELSDLMKISGLGGKRVKALYSALQVRSLEDLKAAAEKKKIRQVENFGEKTEQKILQEIERVAEKGKRIKLSIDRKSVV